MTKEQIRINDNIYPIDNIYRIFNLLKIIFPDEVNIDEFTSLISESDKIELLTRGGNVYGEFLDYNTVYKIEENIVILSNDGSVYVEPEPLPDPEPTEPFPEYKPTLEEVKLQKINELNTICNQMIVNGIDIEFNGQTEHFTYKIEDQNNIKNAFDLARLTGLDIPYHQNEGSCKLYTAEQIINLYISEQTNLTHHQTYFNQMKMYINTLEEKDVVKAIQYGDELTGTYLEAYNAVMQQASVVINTLLEKGVV